MAYLTPLLLSLSLMILASSQNDTQCVDNPTGEVSLNVAVRGVPGPEGPQGPKGVIGPRGNIGVKGDRGEQGEKGERGDTGSIGPKGAKGAIGYKGQKGVRGIQGIPGPVGAPGLEGPIGSSGQPGPQGVRGPQGRAGLPGPRGQQGEPGDTKLTEDEFTYVTKTVHSSVLADLNATFMTVTSDMYDEIDKLNDTIIQEVQTGYKAALSNLVRKLELINDSLNKLLLQENCGKVGNWRRIAYFDTTNGDSCPSRLQTVSNTTYKQTACGTKVYKRHSGCTSLQFPSGGSYTNVCGKVRGYQYHDTEPFNSASIDSSYLTGVSITHGSPRQHLWSFAVGESERHTSFTSRCPCARPNPNDKSGVPSFVGEHFYCESGFFGKNNENRIAWEDPLWDGHGCHTSGNQCCQRYGWFHRQISPTSDNIEVRWCSDSYHENVFTDQLEIWVL